MKAPLAIVMIGATGAVGSSVVASLMKSGNLERLTLLGRKQFAGVSGEGSQQHMVDLFEPSSYRHLLAGHRVAICTLGVGQPSKVSRDEFVRVDKLVVLEFAAESKKAGVEHFVLLSSVDSNARSKSFYLRVKGELEDGLAALRFARLSVFHPSMILTPANRYGLLQGIMLQVWPLLKYALSGPLRKYRGIEVDILGRSMARNACSQGSGREDFQWDEIVAMSSAK